jgi:serine/threonine protein phosphatase 1
MIIIGDIHGCYKTLLALFEKLPKNEKICFVGDLIDRGPDSKSVLDFVLNGDYDCVIGNHEQMMIEGSNIWEWNGADATLKSFEKGDLEKYVKIVKNFPYYKIYDDVVGEDGRKLFLSHAGLNFPDIEACCKKDYFTDRAIVWHREPIVDREDLFQVVGHTPIKDVVIEKHYAMIDTGCVFKGYSGYGKLTALQYPEMKIFQQENIDT